MAACFMAAISFIFILSGCQKDAAIYKSVSNISNNEAVAKPITANLLAWYKFNNGSTADWSGNNNNLTPYHVTSVAGKSGKPNTAFYFDGNNSYMRAGNTSSLNPSAITISALIKPDAFYTGPGQLTRILMKGNDDQTNGVYYVGFDATGRFNGNYGNSQFNNSYTQSDAGLVKLGKWYTLVYTYDGTVSNLYVNGTLVNTNAKVASFNANSQPLRIGKTGRTDYPYWFIGTIDEIKIYDGSVTQLQAKQIGDELGK